MKTRNKKVSVSIGIPAYNEEANIKNLLMSLVAQKVTNFTLDTILVISDGSTDSTVREAKKIRDTRLTVIESNQRRGLASRQNEIVKKMNCDFLILLDADILPKDNLFISKLVQSHLENSKADIVAAQVLPLESDTFFGRMIDWHKHWKRDLYEQINGGDCVFLCHGAARGFSRKAYKQIRWPKIWAEDAYSYLEAKKRSLRFSYCKEAVVYYRSPQTFQDHVMQSIRFITSVKTLAPYFPIKQLRRAYKIPGRLFLTSMIKGFFHQPFFAVTYLVIYGYCQLLVRTGRVNSDLSIWEASSSTKTLFMK